MNKLYSSHLKINIIIFIFFNFKIIYLPLSFKAREVRIVCLVQKERNISIYIMMLTYILKNKKSINIIGPYFSKN